MARPPKKARGIYWRRNADGQIDWYYRIYLHGREQRGGPFATKTEAQEARNALATDHRRGKVDPEGGWQRIDEVIDRHLTLKAGKKDQASQRRFARWWKAKCKTAGIVRVKDLTVRFLEEVRSGLKCEWIKIGPTPRAVKHKKRKVPVGKLAEAVGKYRAGSTLNRYFRWLQSSLRTVKQKQRELFDTWEWEGEGTGRTRYLNDEEEAALAVALGDYAPWMRLAIITGLRQQEMLGLAWKDLDLEQRIATLGQTKSGRAQVVHLSEEAVGILRNFTSWQRSKWIFPSHENPARPIDARNFYHRIWIPAVKRAGIEWATWHDLRHTYASRLGMSGYNESTIAALLRHSGTGLVKRYTHLNQPHLKQAVEAVARFGKSSAQDGSGVSEGQTGNKPETTGSEGERNDQPKPAEVGVNAGKKIGAPDTN